MATSNHSALERFLIRLLQHSSLVLEEQQAILDLKSNAVHANANRDLLSPDRPVEHACLVVSGLAARYDTLANGTRQITAFHIPGDMCDLQSIVGPAPALGVQALTATTVLHVPHAALREIMTFHSAIALAFWRDTIVDANLLARWLTNIGRRDALARLAHLLCELGMRMELAGLGTRDEFALQATQAQLADALGLTPVHVNRTMRALQLDGGVHIRGRTIRIESWERLASLARFEREFPSSGNSATRFAG